MVQPLLSPGPVRRASSARSLVGNLLLVAVVVLPTLIAVQIVLVRQIGARSEPDAKKDGPQPVATRREEAPPSALAARPAPTPPPSVKRPKKEPGPPKEQGPVAPPQPAPVELREALGGLTGSHLTQAHLNIGLIADAVEKELYTLAQGRNLLESVASLLETVGKKLQRLPPDTLNDDEHQHLQNARVVETLLRTQVEALRRYWDRDDRNQAEHFQKLRKQTWLALKELLN
jgi:hypothetical protein